MIRNAGRQCGDPECDRPADTAGLCRMHYTRAQRARIPRPAPPPIEPIDPAEEWRPIPGFEGYYRVSSHGRVESVRRHGARGGLISVAIANTGYPTVSLFRDGEHVMRQVHALIAAAFFGPRPPGMEVRHLDGNKLHCVVSNLAYGTRSENQRDRLRHGTHHQANKTYCPQGHPYDEANTRRSSGRRDCRACHRESDRKRRAARAELRPAMPSGFLTLTDVAQLLGINKRTVIEYRSRSKAGELYANDPLPVEDRTFNRSPLWLAGRAGEIEAWNARRRYHGHTAN